MPVAIFSQTKTTFTLRDTSLSIGQTYIPTQIMFELDKPIILKESYIVLDSIVLFMKRNKKVIIEVCNHIDRVCDYCSDKLSQNRAQSIIDYMVKQGISIERFMARGYEGKRTIFYSKEKISKAKTEKEKEFMRSYNRRTELRIKGFQNQ